MSFPRCEGEAGRYSRQGCSVRFLFTQLLAINYREDDYSNDYRYNENTRKPYSEEYIVYTPRSLGCRLQDCLHELWVGKTQLVPVARNGPSLPCLTAKSADARLNGMADDSGDRKRRNNRGEGFEHNRRNLGFSQWSIGQGYQSDNRTEIFGATKVEMQTSAGLLHLAPLHWSLTLRFHESDMKPALMRLKQFWKAFPRAVL